MLPSTVSMRCANGRAASAACCARRSFDAATICIALVIFCVALVEAMRTRMSLSDAILRSPRQPDPCDQAAHLSRIVMPGLVPGIHVPPHTPLDVDGRDFRREDVLRTFARPLRCSYAKVFA